MKCSAVPAAAAKLGERNVSEYDVIVVGAGNAALCAALSAHENGARTLVLERAPEEERGGNSYFTAGGFRFAHEGLDDVVQDILTDLSDEERDQIILPPHSREFFMDQMREVTRYQTDEDLAQLLVDRSRIALKTVGAMPARDPGHASQGRLPTQGWLEENRWQGYLPYDRNPEFRDPEGGILGNTNNKVIDRPFPEHMSFLWGDTQRVHRWQRLMQSRQVHTRDSFIEAQLDTVSFTARALLPLIGKDLWFTGEAAPEGTPQRLRQRALELLADWNGEMNEHLPEPLIYSTWLRALQTRLIQDDLGPLAPEFTHVNPVFIERVYRDIDGASAWCDIRQSSRVETCSDIARLALDDALVWIDERYGDALESLRWGDAHQATHDHQILGEVPLLRYFVNIRQSTSGGDNTLLRGMTKGTGPNPFLNVHGAGFRGVYDFADPNSSVFIISTGQSGHFLSQHYDDLAQLWRRGEYVPMSLDVELARAANEGITILQPDP